MSFKGREGRIVTLQITEVDNGFIVAAGCKSLVFANTDEKELDQFIALLSVYLKRPDEFAKSFLDALGDEKNPR